MADITKINLKGTVLDIKDAGAARSSDLAAKQDALVSGTNIKTVNNESLLGGGNIAIQGESAYDAYVATTSDNPVKTMAEWVASLHGNDGISVDSDDIVVVHNLEGTPTSNFDPNTQVAALGADMGKELKAQIDALEDTVEELDEGAGYDISVTETAIVFTSRNMPHVSVGEVGNHNVSCKAGNTATTSFYVSGRRLTSAIQIAVSDPTNWSVSPVSISPTDGKVALTLITITYHPASGATADTTHNCNVDVSSGNTTFETIAMVGTVAAAPSITLSLSSATITTTQDTPATATLNVKGAALEGDITLAISGTGFTLSTDSVSKADAESAAGADVTVTFDGSASGDATITATSTNATNATAAVSGVIPTPLAEGSYFIIPASNGNGSLRYTVLSDGNVSVKSNGSISSTTDNPLVIPATINDADATAAYDSGGTAVSPSGAVYNVTTIPEQGFINTANVKAVTLNEGLTTLGLKAFQNSGIEKIVIPASASLTSGATLGIFNKCLSLVEVEFKGNCNIPSYCFQGCTALMKVILNGNSVNSHAFLSCTQFSATEGTKPIVVQRATTPYVYRANSGVHPFPENANSKVWATLYVDTPANWTTTGSSGMKWDIFDEVLDISNYSE